jgi:hypothetical protein
MDIIGFNEQIGNPFVKIAQRLKKAVTPAQQIKFVSRPTTAQLKKKSMIQRAIIDNKIKQRNLAQVIKAQANRIVTAKKPTSNELISAKVTPTLVKSLNTVQRSFLKTDLPYRPVAPKPKFSKIKNTPFSYPIEIDSIQPPVDAGVSNYYGK